MPSSTRSAISNDETIVTSPVHDPESFKDKLEQVPDAETKEATTVQPVETRTITGIRWFIVVSSVLAPTFLYSMDNTIMANIRPSIIQSLGHIDLLPWMTIAYPFGSVGLNPLWAKCYGRFDNKKLFLGALFIFEVGSVLMGAAQSMAMLIVGRALAGTGGGGIYIGTMTIISSMTTSQERQLYLSLCGISWAVGAIIGPLVGAGFAHSTATWRWAFYINVCIAALTVPACVWLVPSPKKTNEQSLQSRLKSLDYVGATLFCGGVLASIMILGFGGSVYSWGSGQMIGLYVAAFVIWLLFVLQQAFKLLTAREERIFPHHYFKIWLMVALFSWVALAMSSLVVTLYTLPLLFQFSFGLSIIRSAVLMLPFLCTCVVSSAVGAKLIAAFPVYMVWFSGCAAIILIGSALLSTIDYTTTVGAICGYSVVQALGVGIVVNLGFTVGQMKRPKTELRQVTAFFTVAQSGGIVLGLGISTCIFLNLATDQIAQVLPDLSRSTIQDGVQGVGTAFLDDLSPDLRRRILNIIAKNAGRLFYLNVAGAAYGLILGLTMPRERAIPKKTGSTGKN